MVLLSPFQLLYIPYSSQKHVHHHTKIMSILSAIFCCFKSEEKDKSTHVVVEAGSLSKKPKGEPQRSSAPIVVSYFPVNSQPSRL